MTSAAFALRGSSGLAEAVDVLLTALPTILPLRIDVTRNPHGLQAELDALERRMRRPGDPLHGLPELDLEHRGFRFRHREADGEHYVYVEDAVRGRLAGCTVFNRLVEVDRRADRHLRSPHSRYAAAYQRRGLASLVYRWWLDTHGSLISGARQSPAAYGLWQAMSRRYRMFHVHLEGRALTCLGREVDRQTRDALHTRLVLIGQGLTADSFARRVGMTGLIEAPLPPSDRRYSPHDHASQLSPG